MKQFFKANIASLIASACDFLLAIFLKEWIASDPVLASITGTVAGGIINFIICRHWAFDVDDKAALPQGKKYFITWAGNLLLNAASVYVLIKIAGIDYRLAKLITSLLVAMAYNYPMQKNYVFKK